MSFLIIPAVDVLGGKCVRLEMGDYKKVTVYSDDPVEMAKKWADSGFNYMHVVDLDGAKFGEPKNIDVIKKIAKAVNIPIEVGGGGQVSQGPLLSVECDPHRHSLAS